MQSACMKFADLVHYMDHTTVNVKTRDNLGLVSCDDDDVVCTESVHNTVI